MYFLEDFRNDDERIVKIRNYNKKFKKEIKWGRNTMEEIFNFLKKGEKFEHDIFNSLDQDYISKNLDFFKTYGALQLAYKSENKIISEITGLIPYKYNIEDCYENMDMITNDILNSINVIDKTDKTVQKLRQDSSGKSEMTIVELYFDSGYCQIGCYDWSDEKGWTDNVSVSFRTKEFNDFLGIAFK